MAEKWLSKLRSIFKTNSAEILFPLGDDVKIKIGRYLEVEVVKAKRDGLLPLSV